MKLETNREDGALIVDLEGRIDGGNFHAFEESLKAEISAGDKAVFMDCEDLGYISSAGLRAILLTAKALWARNGKFALCALSPGVREIMTVAGFDKIIPMHASRADMLASLGG